MQDPDLWDRIDHYEFPRGFKGKLTEAGIGWGQSRACEEYLCFVYLMMISDAPLTPSGTVDAVWHVHLSYTRDYWQNFCAKTLGQDLHHDPCDGPEQMPIYSAQYLKTLALYEREFGAPPPLRFWPTKRLWRRVMAGSGVAALGAVLGLWCLAQGQSAPTFLVLISLALLAGGGAYAIFNIPGGRPSGNGGVAGCGGGAGCGG